MGPQSFLYRMGEHVVNEPFRAIEMLISVPMIVYGLYLLSGLAEGRYPALSVYALSINPQINAELSGTLFAFAGIALFIAARSGVEKARAVACLTLFFAMLWSIIFRATEVGFLPGSLILFYIGLVLAGVDFVQLRGRRER